MSEIDIIKEFYLDDEGKPQLTASVVAFVDVLGVSQAIRDASNDRAKGMGLLHEFHAAFSEALDLSGFILSRQGGEDQDLWAHKRIVKLFSDNVLIAYPIQYDPYGEAELGFVLRDLSTFQLIMATKGFFVRGAVTYGDIFVDQTTIYGPALLEAYSEEVKARFPRIVVTKTTEDFVSEHLRFYGCEEHAPLNRDLIVDFDNRMILNYLDETLLVEDAEGHGPYFDLLEQHRDQISKNLTHFGKCSKIRKKYEWSARYHNYFCSSYRKLDKSLLVGSKSGKFGFSRLV